MKLKKHYFYLVSVEFKGGNGTAMMTLKYKIKTFKDINRIQTDIMKQNHITNVIVHNFIRLKGKWHEIKNRN